MTERFDDVRSRAVPTAENSIDGCRIEALLDVPLEESQRRIVSESVDSTMLNG